MKKKKWIMNLCGYEITPEDVAGLKIGIRKKKKDGTTYLDNIKFPRTITQAMIYVRDNKLKNVPEEEIKSIDDYIEKIFEIDAEILKEFNEASIKMGESFEKNMKEINKAMKKLEKLELKASGGVKTTKKKAKV